MTFTPKFQVILDKVQEMSTGGESLEAIQEYFKKSVTELGWEERVRNLYRIRPKRIVPGSKDRLAFMSPNKMQEDFIATHSNRDLVLKMRQGGFTTFPSIVALDWALWLNGTHTAIMAHKKENVQKYFRIIKAAFKAFQKDWGELYPVKNTIDNVNELKIDVTQSELIVTLDAKGYSLDFLHIAEAAFIDDLKISEALEAVPLSGWIILETTPNTANGMFYDLWESCLNGNNNSFKHHFYPWWWHYPEIEDWDKLKPNKDFKPTEEELVLMQTNDLEPQHILWRRIKISESGGDTSEFLRKYPEDPLLCFLYGSKSVFPTHTLANLWKNMKLPSFVGDLDSSS